MNGTYFIFVCLSALFVYIVHKKWANQTQETKILRLNFTPHYSNCNINFLRVCIMMSFMM